MLNMEFIDYDSGVPLPKGHKSVYRYTKGKFLIVMKNGPYNGINGAYDGRHGDCSADEFRDYINGLIKLYLKLYDYAKQDNTLKHLTNMDIENRISHLNEFNKNPFKNNIHKIDDTAEIKKKIANQQESKDYINQNFNSWNFSDILQNYSFKNSAAIKFVFKFTSPNARFSLETFNGINNYISVDGFVRKLNSNSDEKCYYVYDRKIAIHLKNQLEKKLSEYLIENNLIVLEKYDNCFSIEAIRCGKPTHLFTKQEIKEAMRNADDRFNNQLVIDENGYAKVLKDEGYGYLFPVRHESWNAGNIYVGKYSQLSTLDDCYIMSLQGWLSYLKTGRRKYMDYIQQNSDEVELLQVIKMYY